MNLDGSNWIFEWPSEMINCLYVEIENGGYTPREIEAMEENE